MSLKLYRSSHQSINYLLHNNFATTLFFYRSAFDIWNLATPFPLLSLLVIRLVLVAFPQHNRCYDIIKDVIYTEDIHIVVVLTGVLVFLECLASIFSFWYHLGLRDLIRVTHIKDLKDWHVPLIAILTVGSILHAAWIFMLVRRIWASNFFVLIQFLQAVPNILLVIQSITQGKNQTKAYISLLSDMCFSYL